jgi:hypothetical protein
MSPSVCVVNGFAVRINLMATGPERARQEHGAAHVHVHKADGFARIWLGDPEVPPTVWDATGMRAADVRAARRIVEAHQGFLLAEWRRLNGPTSIDRS